MFQFSRKLSRVVEETERFFFDYKFTREIQHDIRGNKWLTSNVYLKLKDRPLVQSFHSKEKKQMATKKKESAFMKPMQLSEDLVAVVGRGPLPRTEVTKKLWAYIKAHKCQDQKNKRMINPDEKLAKLFGNKKAVNMFEMTKLVSKHLK
jgi:chromatin remodeling complex protein RSC6